MPAVKFEGNVCKTVRAYAEKHADRIKEVCYGGGYATESGMAYDVLLRSGWSDGSDPYGALHTIIEQNSNDILRALRGVRPCDCDDCLADLAKQKQS